MKAYKIEILVIDYNDELNEEEIKNVIENQRYPNHCMSPEVKKIESRDIGEWHDDHSLNLHNEADEEYNRLFEKEIVMGHCGSKKIELLDKAFEIISQYGTTAVDSDYWYEDCEKWVEQYKAIVKKNNDSQC